jgi:hypothetical protein
MESTPQDVFIAPDINHTRALICNETRHIAAMAEVSDERKSESLTSTKWCQQSLLLQLGGTPAAACSHNIY